MAARRNRRRRRRGGRNNRKNDSLGAQDNPGKLYFEAVVDKALPNTNFLVTCDNGMQVLAHLAGKLRRFRIRVLPGDVVRVEVSAYDPTRGRITYRHKRAVAS